MAEHGGGRVSWREAFQPLRNGGAFVSASVFYKLLAKASTISLATSEISPQEVAADLVLLVRSVMARWLPFQDAEAANVCCSVCKLVAGISSRLQGEFKADTVLVLVSFFQAVIKSASSGVLLKEEGSPHIFKATTEALNSLGQIIHDNGGQLPVEEISSLVRFLLPVVGYSKTSGWSNIDGHYSIPTSKMDHAVRSEAKIRICEDERELQRFSFVAIGNIFARAGSSISKDTWRMTVQVYYTWLVGYMQSRAVLMLWWLCCRCYAALLRCVHLLISDPKGSLEEHVAGYVMGLRMFFVYGLTNMQPLHLRSKGNILSGASLGAAAASPENEARVYLPPHLRSKLKAEVHTSGLANGITEGQGRWGLSSDSEQSDSDGPLGDGDRFKSSKARTNAILSIKALARIDPKSLHAHWSSLLLTHDVFQPRPYQATLLTVLLFDPIVKARVAAASTIAMMLEGPVRAFLQVAEHREFARSGPFTSLSGSLGQTVVQLHTGLLHIVSNEKHGGILAAALRALSLLVAAAPYGRLPMELLPNVVLSVNKRMHDLLSLSFDPSNTMNLAINCLGASLNASPASPQIAAILCSDLSSGLRLCESRMIMLVFLWFSLQALRAAVQNYPDMASSFWDIIFRVVAGAIDVSIESSSGVCLNKLNTSLGFVMSVSAPGSGQSSRLADDKLVHSAVKLLDQLLRTISGFEVSESPEDLPLQPPSPSLVPKPITLLSQSIISPQSKSSSSQGLQIKEAADGCQQWLETLEHFLPHVLQHSAPMVRGAALTCFAGLTAAVFCGLPTLKQEYILSAVMDAASSDDAPAVRSAACRAIGVIVGFPQVSRNKENLTMIINIIKTTTGDPCALVQITASWALANLCDVLGSNVETTSSQEAQQILETISLASLAECTFRAMKSGDKVRANAVRALGNLARFANFLAETCDANCKPNTCGGVIVKSYEKPSHLVNAQVPTSQWLDKMVQTFVSCITTGNVKVQWNVCHALGNLFRNPTVQLSSMVWAPSVYSILLLLLRDSANFKIRIHAACALAVPVSRQDYGVAYGDVVQTLVHALESVDFDTGQGPTSFKYHYALKEQLTLTTLHLLALGLPEDFHVLEELLVKRANFLHNWLAILVSADKSGTTRDGHVQKEKLMSHQDTTEACRTSVASKSGAAGLAVEALSAMYKHGGNFTASQNLQKLFV
ncbi:unnamed protein product [Sphagnum troendelagicum]|uniref:DUF4042 domain-containing protein n=1 Tax=Sphagnum troendelagicum TaxID=128251 RepID=A0ABP0TL79_9BRYO